VSVNLALVITKVESVKVDGAIATNQNTRYENSQAQAGVCVPQVFKSSTSSGYVCLDKASCDRKQQQLALLSSKGLC